MRICIAAGGGNAPNSHCCFVSRPLFCKCAPLPTHHSLQRDSCNAVFNTNTSGIIPHHLSFCSPFSRWIKKLQVVQQCCSSGGLAIVEKKKWNDENDLISTFFFGNFFWFCYSNTTTWQNTSSLFSECSLFPSLDSYWTFFHSTVLFFLALLDSTSFVFHFSTTSGGVVGTRWPKRFLTSC